MTQATADENTPKVRMENYRMWYILQILRFWCSENVI